MNRIILDFNFPAKFAHNLDSRTIDVIITYLKGTFFELHNYVNTPSSIASRFPFKVRYIYLIFLGYGVQNFQLKVINKWTICFNSSYINITAWKYYFKIAFCLFFLLRWRAANRRNIGVTRNIGAKEKMGPVWISAVT